MTDADRLALDAADQALSRMIEVDKSLADAAQLIQEQHSVIQALGSRSEGQYEMLSKRVDRAAEEVLKIKTRLKKLEGKS